MTYHSPILISGIASDLAQALTRHWLKCNLRVCGLTHSQQGLEVCAKLAIPGLLLDPQTDLAQRLQSLVQESFHGQAIQAYVDCMQTQSEGLFASLSMQNILAWAQNDIAAKALCLRTIARHMLPQRKGRCIFISSTAASAPAPGQGLYAAAKLACESLYTSLGLELGARGITTTSLRLGWLDCGRGKDFLAAHAERYAQCIPTKRFVRLDEVIEMVTYLLSDAACSLNANTITLDGGFSATKNQAHSL